MRQGFRRLVGLLLVLIMITPTEVLAYVDDWNLYNSTAVNVTYVGQVVDSIEYNGVTVNAVYRPYSYRGENADDSTYSCAAFVHRFYSQVYGITVNNLWSTTSVPQVASGSGSFSVTTSPQVGDIVRDNYSTHWAIVKKVEGTKVTVIQQNSWYKEMAHVGAYTTTSDSRYTFFRYSGSTSSTLGDTVAPVLGDMGVASSGGRITISGYVTDNKLVSYVRVKIYPQNRTDLAITVDDSTIANNQYGFSFDISQFQNVTGTYKYEIFAVDTSDNKSNVKTGSIEAYGSTPSPIKDTTAPVLGNRGATSSGSKINIGGYVTDDNEVAYVRIKIYPQNRTDLAIIVDDSTITNEQYGFSFNISEFGNITGTYQYEIFAVDTSDNKSAVDISSIYVSGIPLTGISLNKSSLTLDAGNTSTLSVNYNPTDTTDSKSVLWSSSDLSVATVDSNGKVTAVAAGTAIITAKVGNYTASCTVTVNAQEVIRINKDTLTLSVGETSVLSVIFNSSELTGSEKVVWCSSDFDVFTVYQSGEVVAKGVGTAYVTVIVDEKYKARCTVNVIDDRTPLEKFVARMYTIALNRDVDPTGYATWVGGLTAGTYDGATVGRGIFLSPEFTGFGLSNDEYLNRLYYTFFDRAPDDSGKQNWLNHLGAGYSREYILSEFINSEEFTNLCQSFDVERGVMMPNGSVVNIGIPKFVSRLYSTVMGRTADWKGYTNWTNTLVVKAQNAQIVATTFFLSPEYLNKNTSNTEFITDLYEAFFDRAPDSSGMTNWKNQLNSGMSRETMVGQFANSEEFKNLAAKYGLE